jgi:D-cysteine desulfhydrase
VNRGELPRPDRIVIGVGSTCTSAGLLLGVVLAARLGVGFTGADGRAAPPLVHSVRVTPWPVTSATRIVGLAARTAAYLAKLAGDPAVAISRADLGRHLHVDGRFLGPGYGHATSAGRAASGLFALHGGPVLDTTYSAKSAAALLDVAGREPSGPLLYWATKSSAPLPSSPLLEGTPRAVRAWIARAEGALAAQP